MGATIFVKPEEIWRFFNANKLRLKYEMVLIAENTDYGKQIYLTNDQDLPLFYAFVDGDVIEGKEGAVNEKDCVDTAYSFFAKFLTCQRSKKPETGDKESLSDDGSDDDMDEIFSRENDLYDSFCDFLDTVLYDDLRGDYSCEVPVEDKSELLDSVIDFLAKEHGFIGIYRPTVLEDGNGEEYIENYPYMCYLDE